MGGIVAVDGRGCAPLMQPIRWVQRAPAAAGGRGQRSMDRHGAGYSCARWRLRISSRNNCVGVDTRAGGGPIR